MRERLGKELLFLDGGMGTLLQERGLQPGELPEILDFINMVFSMHRAPHNFRTLLPKL